MLVIHPDPVAVHATSTHLLRALSGAAWHHHQEFVHLRWIGRVGARNLTALSQLKPTRPPTLLAHHALTAIPHVSRAALHHVTHGAHVRHVAGAVRLIRMHVASAVSLRGMQAAALLTSTTPLADMSDEEFIAEMNRIGDLLLRPGVGERLFRAGNLSDPVIHDLIVIRAIRERQLPLNKRARLLFTRDA